MKSRTLSFDIMREANATRLPLFRNANGLAYHAPDGSDWSLAEWVNATSGEGGELGEVVLVSAILTTLGRVANVAKKVKRGDYSADSVREKVSKELADVVLYCDLLAARWGIDLGESVLLKFNEVSMRIGVDVMMDEFGVYRAKSGQRALIDPPPVKIQCDGDHGGSPCGDPTCWQLPPPEDR